MELVGVIGFEPTAPASRTQCSTRLSYTLTELLFGARNLFLSNVEQGVFALCR